MATCAYCGREGATLWVVIDGKNLWFHNDVAKAKWQLLQKAIAIRDKLGHLLTGSPFYDSSTLLFDSDEVEQVLSASQDLVNELKHKNAKAEEKNR